MRVHELAKELEVSSKDLLAKLRELGVEAKSHMSALDDSAVALVRSGSKPEAAPAETPETPKPSKPAKPARAAKPAKAAKPGKPSAPAEAPKPAKTAAPAEAVEPAKPPAPATKAPAQSDERAITLRGALVVKDLAELLDMKPNRLIAELMSMNVLASITQRVDLNVARKVAEKHGFTVTHEKRATEHRETMRKRSEEVVEDEDKPEDLLPRAPVVTFLGHVDHGKTSLLDKIRNTAVTAGEHGGITQHIGAYSVDVGGRKITFLDTPGHAAFTAMRARGADLTDIAVIIIAADDGIMPQTREAIMHAQAANVALMVAINKTDVRNADVDRVKQQLQAEGLMSEDWGGEVITCSVSAETGQGIDHMLEMILLQAEMLEVRANPARRAKGFVIEARLEPGMGPTANLLVKAGTLKLGDAILCGRHSGRVRALINDHGSKVKSAGPSMPVKCLGLSGVPEAGAEFVVCSTDRTARTVAGQRSVEEREQQRIVPPKASLQSLFDQIRDSEKVELRLILKADTQGSVEAIVHALGEIKSDKVSINFVLKGTGNITVNDIMLASASNAVVMGFHVGREPGVDASARHEGVETRLHQIIYELIDEVHNAMTGLLEPEIKENIRGHAEIRRIFALGKTKKIAGCMMVDGTTTGRLKVRVKRGDEILAEDTMESLKHFQDNVAEVRDSQECGICLNNFMAFEVGDVLEFYELESVAQTL